MSALVSLVLVRTGNKAAMAVLAMNSSKMETRCLRLLLESSSRLESAKCNILTLIILTIDHWKMKFKINSNLKTNQSYLLIESFLNNALILWHRQIVFWIFLTWKSQKSTLHNFWKLKEVEEAEELAKVLLTYQYFLKSVMPSHCSLKVIVKNPLPSLMRARKTLKKMRSNASKRRPKIGLYQRNHCISKESIHMKSITKETMLHQI